MTDFEEKLLEFCKMVLHNVVKKNKASICDYSPDQPRDKNGKWTDGGADTYDKPSSFSLNKNGEKTLDKSERKRYDKILVGERTSEGYAVKALSDHAYDRAAQRKASPGEIRDCIKKADVVYPGNTGNRRVYQLNDLKTVYDLDNGKIITIVRRR